MFSRDTVAWSGPSCRAGRLPGHPELCEGCLPPQEEGCEFTPRDCGPGAAGSGEGLGTLRCLPSPGSPGEEAWPDTCRPAELPVSAHIPHLYLFTEGSEQLSQSHLFKPSGTVGCGGSGEVLKVQSHPMHMPSLAVGAEPKTNPLIPQRPSAARLWEKACFYNYLNISDSAQISPGRGRSGYCLVDGLQVQGLGYHHLYSRWEALEGFIYLPEVTLASGW